MSYLMLGPTGLWWVDLICLELLLKIWDGLFWRMEQSDLFLARH
jgi:hypothetical protein